MRRQRFSSLTLMLCAHSICISVETKKEKPENEKTLLFLASCTPESKLAYVAPHGKNRGERNSKKVEGWQMGCWAMQKSISFHNSLLALRSTLSLLLPQTERWIMSRNRFCLIAFLYWGIEKFTAGVFCFLSLFQAYRFSNPARLCCSVSVDNVVNEEAFSAPTCSLIGQSSLVCCMLANVISKG